MPNRILVCISSSIVVVRSAGFLKPQGPTLKAQLEDSRMQTSQAERRLQQMAAKLEDAQEARNKCNQDLKDLQVQHTYLKKINLQLSENLKILRLELKKKKSVIELQGKVIQLLDDTKKTIETSLKDQIAAQEIEIIETENKLKVIFVDKILFDSGNAEIKPRGKRIVDDYGRFFKRNQRTEYRGRGPHGRCPFKCRFAQTIS